MKKQFPVYFITLGLSSLLWGCIEAVPIETLEPVGFTLADVLVVDARITDENKLQQIFLSRPTALSADSSAAAVRGAAVSISSSEGNTFRFEESDSGTYVSQQIFSAEQGVEYFLEIELPDGMRYMSAPATRGPESTIDRIYAQREFSNLGVDGISIYVDSSNPGFWKEILRP